MHTVKLRLQTTKYDRQVIEKRFHAISHIHNVMVKHAKKLLKRLKYDKEYQTLKAEYVELLKKQAASKDRKLSKADNVRKKELSDRMNDIRMQLGLTEASFQSYIKVCGRQFRKCLSSQQIQKEASRVWEGTSDVIFGKGNDIHFKKYGNFKTICGKTNTNGVKFHKDKGFIEWLGLNIRCDITRDDPYVMESLSADISYCEVKRMMFPDGWHYYVALYLKGNAPKKLCITADKDNITGMDIGTSTVATVSDDMVTLKELAPKCKDYNRQIVKLLKHMDISRRISNPKKYKPDGTIDRSNHDKWVFSKTYLKNLNRLKSLYRQKSAYIKQSHEEMINRLLEDSVNFITEDMSYKALQRKAKKTERQDKVSDIKQKDGKQKDGSVRQVHKYKRKKRFGRSLNNRAPASFITILKRKAEQYGGGVYEVNTKEFRASQYDHVTDEYIKHKLSDREKTIDGQNVQRDLYSAFLLKNTDGSLTKPDRDKCIYGFAKFIELHDELISQMKQDHVTMKQCFGF